MRRKHFSSRFQSPPSSPPGSPPPVLEPRSPNPALLAFRPYQRAAFENRSNGLEVWLWARQVGKSFTLAAWAVDRLITRPGRHVTILSNSRTNGIELNRRCAEVCRMLGQAFEQVDLSTDQRFESFNTETRITVNGRVGRIQAVAANPRTARGFSGDLILDEFAFHEDAAAIWDAAEPILASNRDFLCRVASTPNGKHNMFYRLATDPNIPLRRVTRTEAYEQGCPVFHPITREPITPAEARALATNKRVYDQNYECVFEDENMALLTYELIHAAERPNVGIICDQDWTPAAIAFLQGRRPEDSEGAAGDGAPALPWSTPDEAAGGGAPALLANPLYAGVDVGRTRDRTVISVIEKCGPLHVVRAVLRLENMRLPEQQERLEALLLLPNLRLMKIDMTGLGLGLFEYTHEKFPTKALGLNFAGSIAAGDSTNGSRNHTVRIPEHLATQLLRVYEDRAIHHPIDAELRGDLRKPERLVSPSGRVSIAAARDASGHADHFWSLALAIDTAATADAVRPTTLKVVQRWKRPLFNTWKRGLTF